MFTTNLEKQLRSKTAKSETGDRLLKEATDLLTKAHDDDKDVFKRLGLTHMHNAVNESAYLTYGDRFKPGTICTEAAVKSMAIAYQMRVLPSQKYNGHLSAQMPAAIREFEQKILGDSYKEELVGDQLYSTHGEYMIMAPEELFDLKDRPKPQPVDPILFFKFRKDDSYAIVHTWGDDMSWGRWIMSLPFRNKLSWGLFNYGVAAPLLTLLLSLFTGYNFGYNTVLNNTLHWMPIWAAFSIIVFSLTTWIPSKSSGTFSVNNWNSEYKS